MLRRIAHGNILCYMAFNVIDRFLYRLCPFHGYIPLCCDYSILPGIFPVPTFSALFCLVL